MNKITIKSEEDASNKEKSKVMVGQLYVHIMSNDIYIVADCYKGYTLVSLSDGIAWDSPKEDIDDIFCDGEFKLLIDDKVIIDV